MVARDDGAQESQNNNVWATYRRGWYPMRADEWGLRLDRIWFVTNPIWSPAKKS